MKKNCAILLLGPPGVGKGTYGKLIAKHFGMSMIGCGDIVRSEIASGSDLGRTFKEFSDKGKLIPDSSKDFNLMMCNAIEENIHKGVILDGYPRTPAQASLLTPFLAKNNHKMNLVVNLRLKRDEYLVQKLLGRRICKCGKNFNVAHVECKEEGVYMPALLPSHGNSTTCECGKPLECRADDTEQVIMHRLKVYYNETEPLLHFYQKEAEENRSKVIHFEILKGLLDVPQLKKVIGEQLD